MQWTHTYTAIFVSAISASVQGDFLFVTFQGGEVYVKMDMKTAVYIHVQQGRHRQISGLCGDANSIESGT